MTELGYHPNANARALASNRANVIGLMVGLTDDVQIAATIPYIDEITLAAREHKYDLVLTTGEPGPDDIERLTRRSIVDALVMMDVIPDDPRLSVVRSSSAPIALLGTPNDLEGLYCFDLDARWSARMAMEALLADGCKRFILAGEPAATETTLVATAIFERECLRIAGDHPVLVEPFDNNGGFEQAVSALEAARGKNVGIVARTPRSVNLVVQACLATGMTPGLDVMMVGQCTDEYAISTRIPVSNVDPVPRLISRLAMNTLFALLDSYGDCDSNPGLTLVEGHYTPRATTKISV